MGFWADYIRLRSGRRARKLNERLIRRGAREVYWAGVLVLMIVGWPLYRLGRFVVAGGRRAKAGARTTVRAIAPGPVACSRPYRRTPKQRTISGRWGPT